MTKYKYRVEYSAKFKKSLRKVLKQGKNLEKLEKIIFKLANKEELELKYRNHNLVNDKKFKGCKECHIESDWLLVYKYIENELVLLLINTGSHSELLNM